ncbi:hypothetical protein [Aeromonas jandaei]|uniref:hypothetical protein n=1 Tax=Aeromonas jandaei TaxID=650 RepID=UPI00398608F5
MRFFLVFVVVFIFNSTSYAYQCLSPEEVPASQLHAKTDIVPGGSAIFSANEKRVWFYSYPNASCRQKEIFIVKGDLVYVFSLYNAFYYVEYVSQKGNSVYGWVNKEDLVPYNLHSINAGEKISIADFSIYVNERWISINTISELLSNITGKHETFFVGSYPNAVGGLYKYYSHIYPFGEIISSNVSYNKRMQNIDNSYRLTSILISEHGYVTARGIGVGDTVIDVKDKYKSKNLLDDGSRLTYRLGNYFISYDIKDGLVSSINIGQEFPDEKS